MSIKKIITASAESTGDEVLCVCGECRYCRAHLMSDDDDDGCDICGGGGCARCDYQQELEHELGVLG